MPRLGVVTCQILELEFAHLLSNDSDVTGIWVFWDDFSEELIRNLENDSRKPVHRVAHAAEFETVETNGLAVLMRVMEVGLHSNIPNLRRAVKSAVKELAPFVDAVLLGYGLCGNALKDTEELFADIPVPVSLPMESEADPVDDCVGLIIGGRENYYGEQCRCAGTMFMNAGFSRHWKKILSSDLPPHLIHKKDKIMDRMMRDYKRSLLLPTLVLGEEDLRQNTTEFNDRYGLKIESRPGTLVLLENAWAAANKTCRGENFFAPTN
ncbi:MAG: DUF1638 domain-containing protein [Desulfobacterales bacterium]